MNDAFVRRLKFSKKKIRLFGKNKTLKIIKMEGDLKNKVVEAYEQAKKRQLTGNAPSFSLPDVNGKIHRLEDFKGKYLLL